MCHVYLMRNQSHKRPLYPLCLTRITSCLGLPVNGRRKPTTKSLCGRQLYACHLLMGPACMWHTGPTEQVSAKILPAILVGFDAQCASS